MSGPVTRMRFGIGASNQTALLIVAAVSMALAAAAFFMQYRSGPASTDQTNATDEAPRIPLPAGPRRFGP